MTQLYFDHSATTPLDDRVVETMLPYFSETYGNPSSVHRLGQEAEAAIERARLAVAAILNCRPSEIIFTAGGSESDNLAIRGVAFAHQHKRHLITQPLEHAAVGNTMEQLEQHFGFTCTRLPVDVEGGVLPEDLRTHLLGDTVLVSLMLANNEIGTVLPISELAAVAHQHGAYFHTDAVQAAGQLELDVQKLGVDLMSLSGHKFYGPKGIGVLYVREGTPIITTLTGGGQERGLRSGTPNVPLIVGLARALEIAYAEREQWVSHFRALRDRLIRGVLERVPDVHLTGSREQRLPALASFVFRGVDANLLLMQLDMRGVAASSGSACKVGNAAPSVILQALGYDNEWTSGGLRLSVGRQNTIQDVDYVLGVLPDAVTRVRQLTGSG